MYNDVAWNVRRLNKVYKQKEMKEFLVMNKVILIAIIEHKIKEQIAQKVINKIAPGWLWCDNYIHSTRRRKWIVWNPRFVIYTTLAKHAQFIHGEVMIHSSNTQFRLTVVYGLHTIEDRKDLWQKVKE